MERVKYDPEIDPAIREAREDAEREREMSARIRLEIERYVTENDLVPKDDADSRVEQAQEGESTEKRPRRSKGGTEAEEGESTEKRPRRSKEGTEAEERRADRAKRGAERRKAFQSVFTGNILSNPQIVKLLPYLSGVAVILVLYIANILHLQTLHRHQQRLEEDIKELSIKAVDYSAVRAQYTQRSAIVRRLNEKGIPLYEFPEPLKTIDPK